MKIRITNQGCIPNGMRGVVVDYFLPSDAFIFDKLNASPNGMQITEN